MSLNLLDNNFNPISEFKTTHNGYTGGSYEFKFFLQNDNSNAYYTNIKVIPVFPDLISNNILTESGWSIKIKQTEIQPTEFEWDKVFINQETVVTSLNDLNPLPFWVRVFCPGLTASQIKTNISLKLQYIERLNQ
jgi:hypothetical protein